MDKKIEIIAEVTGIDYSKIEQQTKSPDSKIKWNFVFKIMDGYAEWFAEQAIEECKNQLLRQTNFMKYPNEYPTEAVPKGVILSLPVLMRSWFRNLKKQQDEKN